MGDDGRPIVERPEGMDSGLGWTGDKWEQGGGQLLKPKRLVNIFTEIPQTLGAILFTDPKPYGVANAVFKVTFGCGRISYTANCYSGPMVIIGDSLRVETLNTHTLAPGALFKFYAWGGLARASLNWNEA